MTNDAERLLALVAPDEDAVPLAPGMSLQPCSWMFPFASREIAKAEGVMQPMLWKDYRRVRFPRFDDSPAGLAAWESAAAKVQEYQRQLAKERGATAEPEDAAPSGPQIRRGD